MLRKVFLAAATAATVFSTAPLAEAALNQAPNPKAKCESFLACVLTRRHRRLEEEKAQVEAARQQDLQKSQQAEEQKPQDLMADDLKALETASVTKTPTEKNPIVIKPDENPVLTGASLRETIDWDDAKYGPGTVIVRTPERALYYVLGDGKALKYPVGVGREGFTWSGTSTVTAKAEWPGWTPPPEMIVREKKNGHIIPKFMKGGPGNPLGARAMYLGGRIYRIHGTNNEASIGGAVSSGCIRMMNADVIDLYNRVKIGAKVHVFQ